MAPRSVAHRDANYVPTLIGISSVDLITPVEVAVDPSNGHLLASLTNALSASPVVGQAKIAVTGTAVQLPAGVVLNGVILTAKSTNTAALVVGTSGVTNTTDGTGNGLILESGASTSFAVSNTSSLFINGTSGDIISWAGS